MDASTTATTPSQMLLNGSTDEDVHNAEEDEAEDEESSSAPELSGGSEHEVDVTRERVGSSALEYLAQNTPGLPDDEDEEEVLPAELSMEENALSEEESVMYKDHRRGTVEQFAERNKHKNAIYMQFAKQHSTTAKMSDRIMDKKKKVKEVKVTEVKEKKGKKEKNELLREYALSREQAKRLSSASVMQEIMLMVGSMASFFVQPGNKLFVHLHGIKQATDGRSTLQIWEYVEKLLTESIGQLKLA